MSDTPNINPYDGFRIVQFRDPVKSLVELHVEVWAEGEVHDRKLVKSHPDTDEGYATAQRARLLLEGLVRFLNAFGSRNEAHGLITAFLTNTRDYSFNTPPGWELFHTQVDVEHDFDIIRQDNTDKVIVIKRDIYSEEMTMSDLENRVEVVYREDDENSDETPPLQPPVDLPPSQERIG
jgi:hypothetical protein